MRRTREHSARAGIVSLPSVAFFKVCSTFAPSVAMSSPTSSLRSTSLRMTSLVGFHKGTLLSLSAEGESDPDDEQRRSPIGVDPYLAIPNVVLLHNEQRLKEARRLELRLSRGQPEPSGSRNDRVDINQTANGLDVMQGLLAQHLPNIFHYRAERRLYETGGH